MHPYPHVYCATAAAAPTDAVTLSSDALPDMRSAPPPEFDGPGGLWSPETLLCASITDCFVLTFRAMARASNFQWLGLLCHTRGTLERVEGRALFTRFATHAILRVPAAADLARAHQLLEKSEHGCLIANSLSAQRELSADVLQD